MSTVWKRHFTRKAGDSFCTPFSITIGYHCSVRYLIFTLWTGILTVPTQGKKKKTGPVLIIDRKWYTGTNNTRRLCSEFSFNSQELISIFWHYRLHSTIISHIIRTAANEWKFWKHDLFDHVKMLQIENGNESGNECNCMRSMINDNGDVSESVTINEIIK